MKTAIKVTGFKALLVDIGVAKEKLDDVVHEVLDDAGVRTQNFGVRGIQRGPASGRVYTRGGITHQASAPGQYPMSDTGELGTSVRVNGIEGLGSDIVSVGTNVRHGFFLEFGTSNMLPRPWLTPSFEQAVAGITRDAKKRYGQKFGGN